MKIRIFIFSIICFFVALPVFATFHGAELDRAYFNESGYLTFQWHRALGQTPPIGTASITGFRDDPINLYEWHYNYIGFKDSCVSSATSELCYSIPTRLSLNLSGGWSDYSTGEYGLLYSQLATWSQYLNNYTFEYAQGYFTTEPSGGTWGEFDIPDVLGFSEDLAQPFITISSPASGTTITGTSDTLFVNYYNADRDIYNGILVNFRDNKLNASTKSYDYIFATGDTANGSFSIPFSEFGFNQNGQWNLHGLAYGRSLDIQNGNYLTTRGYVDVFSNDLVKNGYNIILNVAGYAEPFSFQSWHDWYLANVSDYGTPDQTASTIAGYLQPYFEKIGGFGEQASLYFNEAEAYDRGFGLGQIFPVVDSYIKKIDMFFGGFPLFTFFKYIIYTLIAIFVVRTILKFIPFIG